MRIIAFLLSISFLFYLIFGIKNNRTPKVNKSHVQDSLKNWKIVDSIQTLIADTILNPDIVIYEDKFDKRTYKKFDLDSVETYHPLIADTAMVYSPEDILNRIDYKEMNKKEIDRQYYFSSEVGIDNFYILYAHFLKRKTKNYYPKTRQKLFEAYQQINRYYGHWNCGGTYFGHQSWRIIGYAEYDLYNYIKYKQEEHIEPNYQKQKVLFINMLRQRVIDQVNSVQDVYPNGAKRKMLDAVSKLDKSIDSWFILQKAISFEKEHYVYE